MSTTMQDAPFADNHCATQNDTPVSTARGRTSARLNLIARAAKVPATSPERYRLGQPTKTGYRFGAGRFVTSAKVPEARVAILIPGESVAPTGYEVLDAADAVVAWFACIVDALVVRRGKGYAKVVRCSDRALITSWQPPKRGTW